MRRVPWLADHRIEPRNSFRWYPCRQIQTAHRKSSSRRERPPRAKSEEVQHMSGWELVLQCVSSRIRIPIAESWLLLADYPGQPPTPSTDADVHEPSGLVPYKLTQDSG